MKLHYKLESGRWIGGGDYPAQDIHEALDGLKPIARSYGENVIVTRVDNRGGKRGDKWIVECGQ